MKIERQIEIANSFSEKYEECILDINLTFDEFTILKDGIFSSDMDDKWDIFIVDQYLYFARSWTNNCIYKVNLIKDNRKVNLDKIQVTRDSEKYKSLDIESDVNLFKKLLQMYLNREDIFNDERFNLRLIKETIEKYDTKNTYRKSIGSQSVGLNLQIYNGLLKDHSERININGLENFEKNSMKYDEKYELLSLHLSTREDPKNATTYFFNQEATELIGQITIERK
ncbi:MAG: hypothetical protein COB65_01480 [Thalassobium sp.]|nr:MAG: hypothetical protein COB65_01480 [Thalassobium sp.]